MMEFIVPYYFDRICNPLDILLQVPKYCLLYTSDAADE